MQTQEVSPKIQGPVNNIKAVSTPQEIDLAQVVRECATRKSKIGATFNGRKGKNYLFALVCAQVKSLRGMGKESHLDSEQVAAIEEAIADFWQTQANKILDYGTVVSATYDKPTCQIKSDGVKLTLNAKLHAIRDARDNQERKLHLGFCLKQAQKRMDTMLENLGKYDRAQLDKQRNRIQSIESAIAAIK